MPLFLAWNASYLARVTLMWLKVIFRLNPLTCIVDALRTSMLSGARAA
jgi:hypothetical protein